MSNSFDSLPAAFFNRVYANPGKILYSQFVRSDSHDQAYSLVQRTNLEVAERVAAIACFLKNAGLKTGDSVGIISATRPEWLEVDMAVMSLGGVVVSLYPSLVEAEIAYILFDSATKILFIENDEQLQKVSGVVGKLNKIPASEDRPGSEQAINLNKIISFESVDENQSVITLPVLIEEWLPKSKSAFEHSWYKDISPESLASIVYTSGTTGPQKGVMQTHGNHLANLRQAKDGGLYQDESIIFMLLPLAHSFSRLMGYIGFVAGVQLQFPSISDTRTSKANQRRTLLDLSQCGCSVIPLVPRILEKMKDGVELQASRRNIKGLILRLTLLASTYKSSGIFNGPLKLIFSFTKSIRNQIKTKLFGENFSYVISGGAKLAPDVNQFFADLEIEILEGYGLTETCVATNCNRPGKNRIGTVGPRLANDIEIKLADDGEILFRGPNIAKGYLNQPSATNRAWDSEGWFHTGDIGSVSADDYLSITGRKKEIIVTAGGKKISPERIESLLKAHEFISQAMLVGEGRPYCVALVTANREKFQSVLVKYAVSSVDEVLRHPEIIKQMELQLDSVNAELASFETVKKVILIKQDFTGENGLLTPTLKMRRGPIIERYKREIEKLYASSEKVLIEE